jgi:lambda family phage minor tail protein L
MEAVIAERVQSATPGQKIQLFDLDFTPIDPTATVLRFIPMTDESTVSGAVQWRGQTYTPLPIMVSGLEVAGRGSLPRPTLSVGNTFGVANAMVAELGTVSGAILTRWQTFAEFLDTGSAPNPNAYFPTDIFILDRIIRRDFQAMEVECRSYIDFDRMKLPARQMFNNFCSHLYRTWDGAAFDYTNATCPYVGANSFDVNGSPVISAADKCGKRLSDCKLRFLKAPLPTRAFPGVGRIR